MVRVRMAPSPTGNLHLGTAYTTFFNYLFAKKNHGVFLLRLEDTDPERSRREYEKNILDGLKWLGLLWDEGPFRQSDRLDAYKKSADKLINENKAYYCFCSLQKLEKDRENQQRKNLPQVYSGRCRNLSKQDIEKNISEGLGKGVRFKMPEERGIIKFQDILHGEVSFDSKLIGDTVILRSNGLPLYNFSVVVDDIDMGITHVLRGDDHLSNTPKQIVLFEALGVDPPQFAHWPMILNPDRVGKLSKRFGATSINEFKKLGFLPEAILNYFALLGWTMSDDKEIMSPEEMIASFDIKKMRLSSAAFDPQRFEWLNGEYIRMMPDDELTKRLEEFLVDHPATEKIAQVVPLIKERIKKLADYIPLTDFLWEKPEYDKETFNRLKIKDLRLKIEKILNALSKMSKPWDRKVFEETFKDLAKELEISNTDMFQLMRVSVSGQLVTPPLFESIKILGEEETIKRVEYIAENFDTIPNLSEKIKS